MMGRSRSRTDQDRFLILRKGNYHYKRRVPASVATLDSRAPHVRVSLKTVDLRVAREKRDALEAADNDLWASLIVDGKTDAAQARYRAAVRRAEAMGFVHRPAPAIAKADVTEILERLESVLDARSPKQAIAAVFGTERAPAVTVKDAFKVYTSEIAPDTLRNKSEAQKAQWRKVKRRAIDNFIDVVEDKAIADITREDAHKFYRYWLKRIAPEAGRPTHSPSSGNRDIGNMRVLYDEYFKHMGEERSNPFANLGFSEKKTRKRPPFSIEWITGTILKTGTFATMKREYRGIVLAMVETGARPSELCNLGAGNIRLDVEVPHIVIEPRDDPDAPREIKTESSVREIPLVGVALDVFRAHRHGFAGCADREASVVTAINKFMRENKLCETPKHSLYSLRHSFEDRMKNGGVDHELRKILMGHSIDRPDYGIGGSLSWRREQLSRIVLPFDPAIV